MGRLGSMSEELPSVDPSPEPAPRRRRRRWPWVLAFVLAVGIGIGMFVHQSGLLKVTMTLSDLVTENRDLKAALSRLTAEDKIGYAKVLSQETVDGKLMTTLLFVETVRGDQREQVLRREYTIPGDVVHFDALIVRFDPQMVMDGKSRALYLWRRIYGETIAPEAGFEIEPTSGAPARYADLLDELPIPHQSMFWDGIWSLANDPSRLAEHGIRAVYGEAIYTRMQPGLIYMFRIGATGDFYVESVPAL